MSALYGRELVAKVLWDLPREDQRRVLTQWAEALNLSYPAGRAAYVLNRRANTWPHVKDDDSVNRNAVRRLRPVEVMQRMREATAVKWDAHAKAGGAVQKLGVSQADYDRDVNRRQRERREKWMPEGARLRLQVRRARRAAKEAQR